MLAQEELSPARQWDRGLQVPSGSPAAAVVQLAARSGQGPGRGRSGTGTGLPPIILTTLCRRRDGVSGDRARRNASAMGPSSARATSLSTGIGWSLGLPLVATSGIPTAWIKARCKGV